MIYDGKKYGSSGFYISIQSDIYFLNINLLIEVKYWSKKSLAWSKTTSALRASTGAVPKFMTLLMHVDFEHDKI